MPRLHCHPSNSPSTGGSYRSTPRCCQRTTKFGKGNGGYSHCLLLGQHPFGELHCGKEHFTMEQRGKILLSLCPRRGLQDQDIHTNTNGENVISTSILMIRISSCCASYKIGKFHKKEPHSLLQQIQIPSILPSVTHTTHTQSFTPHHVLSSNRQFK